MMDLIVVIQCIQSGTDEPTSMTIITVLIVELVHVAENHVLLFVTEITNPTEPGFA